MQHTDDRERMPNQEGWEESPAYRAGFSKASIDIIRAVQLISPKANEQSIGNAVGLPAGSMVQLLPYDRNRVRATLFNPPTAATPAAVLSTGNTVTAFGSVLAGANINSGNNNTVALIARNDTDVTVTLGPSSTTPIVALAPGTSFVFPAGYISSLVVNSVSAAATLGQVTIARSISTPGVAPTPVTVSIGQKSDIAGGGGYQLPPGFALVIESIDDVYAMASGQVFISRLIEREGGDVL